MTNYLHTASGLLAGSFPWSITAVSTSSASETAAEAAWHSGMAALFQDSELGPLIPSTVTLTQTSTSTATATWHQTTKTVTDVTIPGTATEPAVSFDSCAVITLRTGMATRYGHGRWYLPCLATSALNTDGFFWSPTATGALAHAAHGAFQAWAGTLAIQILHRNGTKNGPPAGAITPVTGGDVSDQIATQRRRADKRVPTRTSFAL
jgi:hypothetical protein